MKSIAALLTVLFSLTGMKAQKYNYSIVADFTGTNYGGLFNFLADKYEHQIPGIRITRNHWVSNRLSIGHSVGYSLKINPTNCSFCDSPIWPQGTSNNTYYNLYFDLNLKLALNKKKSFNAWAMAGWHFSHFQTSTYTPYGGSTSRRTYKPQSSFLQIMAGVEWLPFKARNLGLRLGTGSFRNIVGGENNPGFVLNLGLAYHFNPLEKKPHNPSTSHVWETGLATGFHYQSTMYSARYAPYESNSKYMFSYAVQMFARLHTQKNLRHLINVGLDSRNERVAHVSNVESSNPKRFEETYRQQIASIQYTLEYLLIARESFNLYGQAGLGYAHRIGFDYDNTVSTHDFERVVKPVFPEHVLFHVIGLGAEQRLLHTPSGSLWLGWENSIIPNVGRRESSFSFDQKLTYQSLLRLGWRFQ